MGRVGGGWAVSAKGASSERMRGRRVGCELRMRVRSQGIREVEWWRVLRALGGVLGRVGGGLTNG